MNISRFLTNKESIAGLSIEDNAVVFLSLKRGGWLGLSHTITIDTMAIEVLPPDIIHRGVVMDRAALTERIRKVLPAKAKSPQYVILTIPTQEVYATIIPFPASLEASKLKETVGLAIQYQIPFSLEEAYVDWEKIPGTNAMTDVFIAAAPKTVVDAYVAACTDAGLSVVALEFHSMSVLRSIPKESLPVFIADTHHENVAAYILAQNSVRYQAVIPRQQTTSTQEEFRRIADFYESKEGIKVPIKTLRELPLPLSPSFPKEAIAIGGGTWLPVLGAAIRGFRPREEDVYISLLAIGTEEAYALNRALSFIHLLRMGVFTFSIFLVLIYGGTWLTMVTLQKQSNDQIAASNNTSSGSESSEVEKKVTEINTLVDAIYGAILESPFDDLLLDELIRVMPGGISIQNTQWTTPDATITIQGVAKDRNSLINLKKVLQDSGKFGNITLPLSNLDQKKDIPFTISFIFIDPSVFFQIP